MIAVRHMSATALALVIFAAGCGTMMNGSRQRVRIKTVPPGAALTVDGRELTSPATVWLDRERDYTVLAEMNGFAPTQRELQSVSDPWMAAGNCLFFLCIPQLWESDDPSHYRLDPEELEVPMDPIGWSPR